MEEPDELARAVRKNNGQRTLTGELVGNVDEELVDILIFAHSIASRLGIDLTDATWAKETLNDPFPVGANPLVAPDAA
jgi:NTP pyrophosphatase (non-canonical NTP hydrolase)